LPSSFQLAAAADPRLDTTPLNIPDRREKTDRTAWRYIWSEEIQPRLRYVANSPLILPSPPETAPIAGDKGEKSKLPVPEIKKSEGGLNVRVSKIRNAVSNLSFREAIKQTVKKARAKARLADEYDAAQQRGEVRRHGNYRKSDVPNENITPTVTDIGPARKQVHEARNVRDAIKQTTNKRDRSCTTSRAGNCNCE
jgi:hypothetical protein